MVKVYSMQGCPWCDKTKKYLQSKGVEFEVHNIDDNEEDLKACINLSGDSAVPVTTADDENFVLGFDKPKLDAMLNL